MRSDPAILGDSDLLAWRHWAAPLGWFAALGVLLVAMPHLGALFAAIDPEAREPIYRRDPFIDLLANHLLVVAGASSIAIVSGVSAAIMVTRPWGRDFLPLVSQLASIGQTFPPVAVLALAVPWLGFGGLPTVVALVVPRPWLVVVVLVPWMRVPVVAPLPSRRFQRLNNPPRAP